MKCKTFIINGRFLTQQMTGVHRYAYEICCALKRLNISFVIVAPRNILPEYNVERFVVEQCGSFSSHIWEQVELPVYLKRQHKGKLLVSLMGLGSICYPKTICTIHDVSYLENPAWFSKSYYYFYRLATPVSAKRALKIITVSHFSKNELMSRLNIAANKIEVIYNAVSEAFVPNERAKPEVDAAYVLTVSSIDPRKNFGRLVDAFNRLNTKGYKLYIIGKKNRVFGDTKFNGLNDNIVFTGYVTDEELNNYYRNASLFVYPSLYEGFGIPNLEAMNNGCPVVTSDIPPHREVCGDAAIYFNPVDVEDMSQKIALAMSDPILRKAMIEKGEQRASLFSWEQSAATLIRLIEEIG